MFKNKKDLQKIWAAIEPNFLLRLPKGIIMTDQECSIGWDRETYIAVQLNNKWIFFIFTYNDDGLEITIYSHEQLPVHMMELAVIVKNTMVHMLFPKEVKKAKASKAE